MTAEQTQQSAMLGWGGVGGGEKKTVLTLLRLDLPQGWIQPLVDMMDYCNGHLNGLFVMFKWQYIFAGKGGKFNNVRPSRQMMCLRCK